MRLSAVVIALSLVLFTHPGAALERLSAGKYVEFFDIVTFGSEFASTKSPGFVRKWPGTTVKYKLTGIASEVEYYRAVVERHAKALYTYTGLSYTEIAANETGQDLTFVFAGRNTMKAAGRVLEDNDRVLREVARANCFFLSYHNPKGQIVRGLIGVNSELPRVKVEHCLLEEMAHSLGLPNDSRLLSPSIFNDREDQKSLTMIDKVLLRTLYDSRIKAGTARPQALRVAARVVKSLMAEAK